ncbi:pimeloyl-ACP methyl esterase BioG family protein [Ruegeria arenilitoris]|uniref:pimeloyl-ACP methyl esterase BioG family protein n=1 Tax=Ruegeria arenilitoris TaxID=1173585 RepID=UPI00147B830D|nr:pimeloyl-ACP methyl esterase BioG family protein [Ruegeria arenilitoris]
MKQRWLSRNGANDLILIFGGWALGAAPFAGLVGGGDVLFVDDYTRLDDPLPDLEQYDHVDLIAFSFGVASAGHWLAQTGFRPKRLVAVSGTLCPADPERGITPDMIRATADNLTESSFAKFCRRAGLEGPAPRIDISAARAELHAVIDRGDCPDVVFDRIWIPERDRIIPTRAQEAAWHDHLDAVRSIAAPHVPFRSGQSWQEWLS